MLNLMRLSGMALLTLGLMLGAGCAKKATTESTSTTGGSGSSTYTATDLAKTWNSSCIAAADLIAAGDHYQTALTLAADGTFSMAKYVYTGTCSPVNYTIIYNTSGTFTVGALVSGSTTVQTIAFTVNASDMMAMSTTAQTAVNNDCGGTSPYSGGVGAGNNGVHNSTYMMNCMSMTMPNSGNKTVNNIATLASSVFTMGSHYNGIPGQFTSGTVAATVSLAFN